MYIALPLGDFLLACRYAYYCKAVSIIPDVEYDALEAQWYASNEPLHALHLPGSDIPSSYSPHIRALALYYMTRHGVTSMDPDGEFDFGL